MLRYKEQKCGTVFDVVLQCFIVSVADREPLIVPDFPPGFIKGFDDSKDRVSVFVGIADKYVWFFFVCQKRRGEFFNSRREQPVKGLVLVIKDKCEMVFLTKLMGAGSFMTDERQLWAVAECVISDFGHTFWNDDRTKLTAMAEGPCSDFRYTIRNGDRSQALAEQEGFLTDYLHAVRYVD